MAVCVLLGAQWYTIDISNKTPPPSKRKHVAFYLALIYISGSLDVYIFTAQFEYTWIRDNKHIG